MSRSLNRATLAGLVAILLWSSTIAVGRRISEQLGPATAGAAVYLTAALLLAPVVLSKRRAGADAERLSLRYLIGCGALFVTNMVTLFLALGLAADRSQTVEVGLLNYLWPAFTLLFSVWLLDNRASWGLVPGTVLALLGVAVVLTGDGGFSWASLGSNLARHPLVYALGLTAAISWGLYSNLARRWGSGDSTLAVLFFVLATGLAFLGVRLLRAEAGSLSLQVVLEVAFLGTATALAYSLWDVSMRQGEITLVAALSYLTPFFSTVVSSLYLHVGLTKILWLGCGLIILGSFWSWRSIVPAERH
jgi:drug/metabolite transporter (DMT)-like permease